MGKFTDFSKTTHDELSEKAKKQFDALSDEEKAFKKQEILEREGIDLSAGEQNGRLSEIFKNHEPFSTVSVKTTGFVRGVDNMSKEANNPMEVYIARYDFDEEGKTYKLTQKTKAYLKEDYYNFDKAGFNPFEGNAIEKEAYLQQAVSLNEVQKGIQRRFDNVPNLLVFNEKFISEQLSKLGVTFDGQTIDVMRVCEEQNAKAIDETGKALFSRATLSNCFKEYSLNEFDVSAKTACKAIAEIACTSQGYPLTFGIKDGVARPTEEYRVAIDNAKYGINIKQGEAQVLTPEMRDEAYGSRQTLDASLDISSFTPEEQMRYAISQGFKSIAQYMQMFSEQQHGQLYSDKKGDTVDIVAGEVTKVGEATIPYVGDAPQQVAMNQEQYQQMFDDISQRMDRQEALLSRIADSLTTISKAVTRTVDKTEKDNAMKNKPVSMKDDLKGHKFETEVEIEEPDEGRGV